MAEPSLNLTPEEIKFFESRGEAELPATSPEPAPPPESAPAPIKEPEPAPAAEQIPPIPGLSQPEPEPATIPYAALKEERNRRKAAEQRERETAERIAQVTGRLDQLQTMFAPPRQDTQPVQPAGPIDVHSRPIDALEDAAKRVQQLEETEKQRRAQEQNNAQWNSFSQAYAGSAREFAAKQPDFQDAYAFVLDSRMKELQALGWDQSTAQQIAQSNEVEIVAKAFADKANPAERLYQLAKLRGYAPVSRETPRPNGASPAPQNEIGRLQRAQAASKSLSGAGGGPVPEISLEGLLDMDNDEFAKFDKKKWRKLWDS